MASFKLLVAFFLVFCGLSNGHPLKMCRFDQIYQLGDSISDTGNLIHEAPNRFCDMLPYGETFSNKATGRCSNGLLMIDYIAMAAGVPLLPPYRSLVDGAQSAHGVNFAVAGATALSTDTLTAKRIFSPVTNTSLEVQLGWMFNYIDSLCNNYRDCSEKLQNALFMVGEIGGNDINYAMLQGKSMPELATIVSQVVAVVLDTANKVIDLGATRLVIPGNFPIGCLPIYKTTFQTNISEAYDENHCLKHWNDFAKLQNQELQKGIHKLKQENPNVAIVYGDYYNAYQFLLQIAKDHGMETEKACCGFGGKYNFNRTKMCGVKDSSICDNPDRYVSWDGVHSTQQAYEIMASWLLSDIFPNLHCHFSGIYM